METKGSLDPWSRLIRWIQRSNCIFNGTPLCRRDQHLHWIPGTCVVSVSSLAQTLHYPDIRPSWWPHLAQVHTSCAFECLCPFYNFSPICLVNVNLELRILEAIQSDSVVISLSYLFDLFLLTLLVLYQESGHTRWSPMSHVMSLSMSEHCHHCQGTGPAVSRGN